MDLLASGTLTFLFTDLEGSTRLWEQFPDAMKGALKRHDTILRAAIEAAGGHVVKTRHSELASVCHAGRPSAPSGLNGAPQVSEA